MILADSRRPGTEVASQNTYVHDHLNQNFPMTLKNFRNCALHYSGEYAAVANEEAICQVLYMCLRPHTWEDIGNSISS